MKTRCNCAWFCMREDLPLGQPAPSHTMPTALLGGLQGIAAWRAQKPISSIHAHLSGLLWGWGRFHATFNAGWSKGWADNRRACGPPALSVGRLIESEHVAANAAPSLPRLSTALS